MSPEEAEKYQWNIFDMTKVWPHKDFPLQQIGRRTMNRNVSVFIILAPRKIPKRA
jgi:catalase